MAEARQATWRRERPWLADTVVCDGLLPWARDFLPPGADLAAVLRRFWRSGVDHVSLTAAATKEGPAEALARMNRDAMVFAMANPTPEVSPEDAMRYARVVATGRSDYPNQINNVLAFPGVFRGALDVRAPQITEPMKMAAAQAIADAVPDPDLREDLIVPSVFDREVAPAVADAVAAVARAAGDDLGGDTIGFAAADVERLRWS